MVHLGGLPEVGRWVGMDPETIVSSTEVETSPTSLSARDPNRLGQ